MTSALTGAVIAAGGRWHLGIGDPDAIAWVIVGAYAVAVGLAVWASTAARRGYRLLAKADPREAANQRVLTWVWLVVAVLMLVLGINKQLDLQTWFLQTVRRKAFEGGWYDDRRRYQADFIGIALLVSVVTSAIVAYVLRRVLRRIAVTIVGLAMLVLFVIVRAISFHYVDYVLRIGGRFGVNAVLELSGISLISVSALIWQRGERGQLEQARARVMHRRRIVQARRDAAAAAAADVVPATAPSAQ